MANKKNAPRGEGHFKILDNGKCSLDFYYTDLYDEKRKKQVRGIDKNECIDKRDLFLSNIEKERCGININDTIPDICHNIQKIKRRKNLISDAAYQRNIDTIKIIERSEIANIPIRQISDAQLGNYIDSLIDEYAQSTINKVYRQIQNAYKNAYANSIIDKDPFNDMNNYLLTKPVSRKETKKVMALNLEEQIKLINILKDSDYKYKNVLLISLYSGLRIGEVLALNVEDINFEKGTISVTKTITRGVQHKLSIKNTPKTESGNRNVPIFPEVEPILEDAIKHATKSGALFRTLNGQFVSTAMVTDEYKTITKKHNLAYYGGHSLRHTFVTNCCNADVPIQVLMRWVGHSDMDFMLKTYYDLLKEQEVIEVGKVKTYMDNNLAVN